MKTKFSSIPPILLGSKISFEVSLELLEGYPELLKKISKLKKKKLDIGGLEMKITQHSSNYAWIKKSHLKYR